MFVNSVNTRAHHKDIQEMHTTYNTHAQDTCTHTHARQSRALCRRCAETPGVSSEQSVRQGGVHPELQPSPEHTPPLPCSHMHFSYKQASRARRREHGPRAWGGVRMVRKPMGAPCSCQAQSGWGGLLRLGPGGSGPITDAEPSVGPRLSVP